MRAMNPFHAKTRYQRVDTRNTTKNNAHEPGAKREMEFLTQKRSLIRVNAPPILELLANVRVVPAPPCSVRCSFPFLQGVRPPDDLVTFSIRMRAGWHR
jgi:hypothetical protein